MKILVVCSYKNQYKSHITPFVEEQADALRVHENSEVDYFLIKGKGMLGYLRQLPLLKRKIKSFQPEIIHAHFGLSGLLANLQRQVPVVTTYHGSDINNKKLLFFSKLAIRLSAYNIFVSQKNIHIAKPTKKYALIPCGINFDTFYKQDKNDARLALGFTNESKLVLFAGAFDVAVKNPTLAKDAVNLLPDVQLIELKGYTRTEVCTLLNAVDVALMTSHTEGSPQFIKEALACGCPVVSVDVGDVAEVIEPIAGCYIVDKVAKCIANKLQCVMENQQRIDADSLIQTFDNKNIANRIMNVYSFVKN